MISTARKYAEVSTAHFPAFVVELKAFEPSLQEFREHLDELTEIITTHTGIVLILNISKSKFLPSELRIEAGKWLKKEKEAFRKNVKGMAFINDSVVMKMVLKGVLLVATPPVDHTVLATVEEGLIWANKKFISN